MGHGTTSQGIIINPTPFQKLSIIVPCFNEEGQASRLENELIKPLQENYNCEFVFVDDGSSDQTYANLEIIKNKFKSVVLVKHNINKGLGAALRTGFHQATGDAILTLDSDLTFHPTMVPDLINRYNNDVSCVLGSPQLGGFDQVSFIRRGLSNGVNLVYQLLLGDKISSTSSIFRLYRSSDLKNLSLKSTSFDINAEIISKLILTGKCVVEVPARLTTRLWGDSKINVGREIKNHLILFLKIILWKLSK